MRRVLRILAILLLAPPLIAAVLGWFVAPSFLHPIRRPLTPDLVQQADASFAQIGVHREAFDVRTPDSVLLRGWKVRASQPNGSWVLLFHGVADNRMGVLEHALVLLHAGYSVTMMGARLHGESEGRIATYGWLERNDTRAILDALIASEHPAHIFALGESMGAGIALQSAGADPRIEAVVAESPFGACAKPRMITPACGSIPSSAKLCLPPAPGSCWLEASPSPDFLPQKFPPNALWQCGRFRSC